MSFNIKEEKVWVSKYEIWAHSTILILNSYNLCTNCALNLFYIQRPVSETSHPILKFDSGCLAVAYFGGKIG
jgi:hypothetical protein